MGLALLAVPCGLLATTEATGAARVLSGQADLSQHLQGELPFYEAFTEMDEVLPKDASLRALRHRHGAKLPNAYDPRPIALVADEVPAQTSPFFLWVGDPTPSTIRSALHRRAPFNLGEAWLPPRSVTWSTRGRKERSASLAVYALDPATDSASPPPQ